MIATALLVKTLEYVLMKVIGTSANVHKAMEDLTVNYGQTTATRNPVFMGAPVNRTCHFLLVTSVFV